MVEFCVLGVRHLARSHDCAWAWKCQLKHRLEHLNCPINPQKFIRMPNKKHSKKARNKNVKKAQAARLQRPQGEYANDFEHPPLIPTDHISTLKTKKLSLIIDLILRLSSN